MTIEQAINILDPDTQDCAIAGLEKLYGVDAVDVIVANINEACN